MDINIGDTFIINYKKVLETYPFLKPCCFPNKVFTIDGFSKSGLSVYYYDNRTNIKCDCKWCNPLTTLGDRKSIGKSDIIIQETFKQRERNLKLKKLIK